MDSANISGIPVGVMTDSYKAGHFRMYPEAIKMSAYGEFRKGYMGKDGKHDKEDTRLLFYGIRYIVENFLSKPWTMEDVERCDQFYKSHLAPFYTEYPWPRHLFEKIVKENKGYFPVKIEALPEGSVVNVHVPVYQITAEKEWTPLCTFLETLLTMVWYPTCVATLSRRSKDVIKAGFDATVDEDFFFLLGSRLHDFGFRGCTCAEQSVIGGAAHLLNFDGTDTMSAAYYVQFHLNGGKAVGQSIPATEHSVMTSWKTEAEAVSQMVDHFGEGLFACVWDSYDYSEALRTVLPQAKILLEKKNKSGNGFMIIRPDSGDPVEAVLEGLQALDKVFGSTVNKKGFKVINGAGIIQGDGINIHTIQSIVDACIKEKFSLQCVAFGMGGGLLQKVNRDTMSFATKLSHIHYAGQEAGRDLMKAPKTDNTKFSLPGILQVKKENGVPTVYSIPDNAQGTPLVKKEENMLKVVYDMRPLSPSPWDDFTKVRERAEEQWAAMAPHKKADPISPQLLAQIKLLKPNHGT